MRLRRILAALTRLDRKLPPPRHPWDTPPTYLTAFLWDGVDEAEMQPWQRDHLPRRADGRRVELSEIQAALLPRADCSDEARFLLRHRDDDDQADDSDDQGPNP
jgi:hypothetical protein